MARRPARRPSYGVLDTIEYIGPRPVAKPPKRSGFFGGWVILLIAVGVGIYFGRPLWQSARAEGVGASASNADALITELAPSPEFGNRLAAAALQHTKAEVAYDPAYYKISYPNGDIPSGKGKAEDVVIRCYRALGIDLQKLVHEDMAGHFSEYPQLWDLKAPDTNIDHRRVPNLQRFFSRQGGELPVTREPSDYHAGDVVTWGLANGQSHIGIVVPCPGGRAGEPWVVHNLGNGPKWENSLFEYRVLGHYRFTGKPVEANAVR